MFIYYLLHTWAHGVRVLTPSGQPVEFEPTFRRWGRGELFQRKPLKTSILHYPFMTLVNHNVPGWKFSMQKCIKRQIFSLLILGESAHSETFHKPAMLLAFYLHDFSDSTRFSVIQNLLRHYDSYKMVKLAYFYQVLEPRLSYIYLSIIRRNCIRCLRNDLSGYIVCWSFLPLTYKKQALQIIPHIRVLR